MVVVIFSPVVAAWLIRQVFWDFRQEIYQSIAFFCPSWAWFILSTIRRTYSPSSSTTA
jgi:hypothetical protein